MRLRPTLHAVGETAESAPGDPVAAHLVHVVGATIEMPVRTHTQLRIRISSTLYSYAWRRNRHAFHCFFLLHPDRRSLYSYAQGRDRVREFVLKITFILGFYCFMQKDKNAFEFVFNMIFHLLLLQQQTVNRKNIKSLLLVNLLRQISLIKGPLICAKYLTLG